jgi:predicted transcriptional regulator
MKSTKKEKTLSIRVHPDIMFALTKAADANSTTPSWLARKAIRNYLIQHYPEYLVTETDNNETDKRTS